MMTSMIRLLILSTCILALGSCQKKKPPRTTKTSDPVVLVEPISPKIPVVPVMTADPTPVPVVEEPLQPAEKPDPIEDMTIPEDPLKRAELYFSLGYGASAILVLQSLPEDILKKQEVQLLLGRASYLSNRFRDAVAACGRAADTEESQAKAMALACQGRAYLSLKEHAKALRTFESALKADPEDLGIRLSLMDAHLQMKNRDALLKLIQKTLEKTPDEPVTMLYLGAFHELSKSVDRAAEVYEKLVQSHSTPAWVEAEAFDRLGILFARSNPKKSLEILQKCRQRVPKAACPRTELFHSPPDPRHPERRIRNVSRPGRYGQPTTP